MLDCEIIVQALCRRAADQKAESEPTVSGMLHIHHLVSRNSMPMSGELQSTSLYFIAVHNSHQNSFFTHFTTFYRILQCAHTQKRVPSPLQQNPALRRTETRHPVYIPINKTARPEKNTYLRRSAEIRLWFPGIGSGQRTSYS